MTPAPHHDPLRRRKWDVGMKARKAVRASSRRGMQNYNRGPRIANTRAQVVPCLPPGSIFTLVFAYNDMSYKIQDIFHLV